MPAVIAMQGNLTMQTAAAFMPVFFAELRRDGQVDRAMAVARGAVRERPDWWMPVLFMRLRSGRIGYNPGFGDEREGLRKWPALAAQHPGRVAARRLSALAPANGCWARAARLPRAGPRTLAIPWTQAATRACPRWPSTWRWTRMSCSCATSWASSCTDEVMQRYGEWLPPGSGR